MSSESDLFSSVLVRSIADTGKLSDPPRVRDEVLAIFQDTRHRFFDVVVRNSKSPSDTVSLDPEVDLHVTKLGNWVRARSSELQRGLVSNRMVYIIVGFLVTVRVYTQMIYNV